VQRPLGCLTATALLTAAVAALLIALVALLTGNGIFSPGRLNAEAGEPIGGVRAHSDLEARCEACHPAPWATERMADRCLACHAPVAAEFASSEGLHGLLATSDSCRDCHTDHHGPSASLTLADPGDFPHERTGYVLTAHKLRTEGGTFACSDCHPASLTTMSQRTCLECHQRLDDTAMTVHVATFGATCLPCHDGRDTYGEAFDHRTWPLVGKHEGTACGSCHEGARDPLALRTTPTICIGCHRAEDVHDGRLGSACDECHQPSTWRDATIDHDRTRFKLTGEHREASCLECHVDRQWVGIGQTCAACHGSEDPHDGQFGRDCGACHRTSDWDDVTFDHARTAFPLTGAHRSAACQRCHLGGVFSGTPRTCAACHARPDTHLRRFSDCAACHTTRAWRPASFTVAHPFPINHRNADGVCSRCHPVSWAAYTCARCHPNGKMAEEHNDEPGYTPDGCLRCHPTGRKEDD
jgi:hypothetical protein